MSLQIIDHPYKIEKLIMKSILDEINSYFQKNLSKVEDDIAARFKQLFATTPEYDSLTQGGTLSIELGIKPADAIRWLDSIIAELLNQTHLFFSPFSYSRGNITGGLTLAAFEDDFQKILSMPAASYVSYNSGGQGTDIDWLKWMLTEGDRIIIQDYSIRYGNYTSPVFNSRTGKALMVAHRYTGIKFWRMPPQYSGTMDNNWITRAIDKRIKFVEDIVYGVIVYHFDQI